MTDRWGDASGPRDPGAWAQRRMTGLEDDVARLRSQLEERLDPSQRYLDLVREKHRLQAELAQLQRREALLELEADRERRAFAAEVERLHRQVERAAQRRQRPPARRAIRSAHIVVDPDAWAAIKRTALRTNRTLASLVTELIVGELNTADDTGQRDSPRNRRRRSPGEGPPRPQPRVVRLDCDDDTWQRLRLLAAVDVGLSLGRHLGEMVQAAAFNEGWRAKL